MRLSDDPGVSLTGMSRGPARKRVPPPLPNTEAAGDDEPPLILGGSLTRSPEGRLWTLQTHGMHPSPQLVQEVWSNSSRRRYPAAWQGQPLAESGFVIEFEERAVACACGRSLGDYVAYRVIDPTKLALRGERGVIEKTSRRYQGDADSARGQAGSRGPKSRPRYRLERETGGRAAKTSVRFLCPGCGREHCRNLTRLGEQLFEHPKGQTFLLD